VPILRWFTLYLLFSPLSRALGMLLDSVNRPQYNLYKVGVMVAVNVAGDVAVLLLWESIPAVAAVTTLTLLSGVGMGLYFVRPFVPVRVSALPAAGRDAVAEQWQRWTRRASRHS
jgi:O-antigen/teichoic acid export membrane protein